MTMIFKAFYVYFNCHLIHVLLIFHRGLFSSACITEVQATSFNPKERLVFLPKLQEIFPIERLFQMHQSLWTSIFSQSTLQTMPLLDVRLVNIRISVANGQILTRIFHFGVAAGGTGKTVVLLLVNQERLHSESL